MMSAEGDKGAGSRVGRKSRAGAGARLKGILEQEAKDLRVSSITCWGVCSCAQHASKPLGQADTAHALSCLPAALRRARGQRHVHSC